MGVDISNLRARSLIESAIVDNLCWAYGRRKFTSADFTALRAVASVGMIDRSMCFVTASGYAFQWQKFQTAVDDNANFIQPTDVASGKPGRWCRVSATGANSTLSTGYLNKCELYNDDAQDLNLFVQRLFGDMPAMLLSYEGTERQPKSSELGAVDWCEARFTLFVISESARGGQAARQGSPVAAEAAKDPGTAAMLADAMLVLKGAGLGLNDVAYVRVRDDVPVIQDLARARYVESLEISVYYTETNPDPTIVPLGDPYEFNLNFNLAELDQTGAMNTSNDVTSTGLQFALGDGLNKSFAGGTMNFNGTPLTVPGASHTFSASKVTYRDVDASGVMHYTETSFGDAAPTVAFGQIRFGVTFSDSTGVRLDRILAAQLIPFGPTDKVLPPTITVLALSPTNLSLGTGTDVQFTVTATRSDGTTGEDVTALVTWTIDNANTTISPAGIAHTTTPGTAHITATLNGVASNTATLTAT